MFDSLSDRLESVFRKLRGHGRLDENNIQEGLREVRMALLEADVNFRMVKKFIESNFRFSLLKLFISKVPATILFCFLISLSSFLCF